MLKKIEYYIKRSKVLQIIYRTTFNTLFRLISSFYKVDEKIYLFTGQNGGINDSSKIIFNRLYLNKSSNIYYWGVSKSYLQNITDPLPQNVRCVFQNSLQYFLISFKAKYWIASVNIERGLNYKKKNQIYLNTWHGIPIKKIGNDAKGRKDYNFSKINYFVISSEYEAEIYKKAFNLQPTSLIRTGLPRNDELFTSLNQKKLNEIKSNLGLPSNKKIILYAPTWRDSENKGKSYVVAPPINFEYWKKELGNEYIVLVRLHPYTEKILNVTFNDFVVNVSNHGNVNELILIADILITDYSAISFDFSIREKPMFCFCYDLEDYMSNRGLYMDLKSEFPGGVQLTETQLIGSIKNYDEQLIDEIRAFKKKYITYGGNSTDLCIKHLLQTK